MNACLGVRPCRLDNPGPGRACGRPGRRRSVQSALSGSQEGPLWQPGLTAYFLVAREVTPRVPAAGGSAT